jgi:four helix bundle protein
LLSVGTIDRIDMLNTSLRLEEIRAYKISYTLSNQVWYIVKEWDYLAKDTIGKQYVRSIDSISANIAEGFGRYHKRDKIKFYRYSYGSLRETLDWTEKAFTRELISREQYKQIIGELGRLPREINYLIKLTNDNLKI